MLLGLGFISSPSLLRFPSFFLLFLFRVARVLYWWGGDEGHWIPSGQRDGQPRWVCVEAMGLGFWFLVGLGFECMGLGFFGFFLNGTWVFLV